MDEMPNLASFFNGSRAAADEPSAKSRGRQPTMRMTAVVQRWEPPVDEPQAPVTPETMTPEEKRQYVLSQVERHALDVGLTVEQARQLRGECENDPIKAMRVLGLVPRDFRP